MIWLFGNIASPGESRTTKERDDKENFLFIRNVGVGAHVKRESALSHEVTEFGNFTREFGGIWDLGVSSCLSRSFERETHVGSSELSTKFFDDCIGS